MSTPRFYCQSIPDCGQTVSLDTDESRHAMASKRLAVGDPIEVFDGIDTLARATVADGIGQGRQVVVRVGEIQRVAMPAREYHLAAALPKRDRVATMLNMATQLGMTAFTPLLCARSIVKPGASAPSRWHKVMVEACKQSKRVFVPRLHPAQTLETVLRSGPHGRTMVIAHPGSACQLARAQPSVQDWLIIVGPEGGFTAAEIELGTQYGANVSSLGDGILRTETAAVAALAVIRAQALALTRAQS